MHDMLVVGAERLQSAAQAKLQVNAYRARLRRMKRETDAAILVQAVWRAGKARVAVDEMRWGAMIVQANFRAHRDRTVFVQVRWAAFHIQKHARGHACRVSFQKFRKSAIAFQAAFRGWWARRDLKNRALRHKQLVFQLLADAKQLAAVRVQALFRGLQGRKIARAEQLRKMAADTRLSEIERAQRAQETEALLKQQAVEWREQQEKEAARLRRVEQDRKQRELEAARALVGDTGAIIRVTRRGAPGYGTFVAAFGLSKNTDWINESQGDRAFR